LSTASRRQAVNALREESAAAVWNAAAYTAVAITNEIIASLPEADDYRGKSDSFSLILIVLMLYSRDALAARSKMVR
jgi:hypothetical protein